MKRAMREAGIERGLRVSERVAETAALMKSAFTHRQEPSEEGCGT